MTRAEFAKAMCDWFEGASGKRKDENLVEFIKRCGWTDGGWNAVADIATNGFDPEPVTIDRQVQMRVVEQLGEAAKRSRPFIGSHNLPYDSDWD